MPVPRPVVAISGASGLIGSALCRLLGAAGYPLLAISRRPAPQAGVGATVSWDELRRHGWRGALADAAVVVNLAGESLAAGRWSRARRQEIRDSRLRAGRLLVTAIAAAPANRPALFIQASAIGIYGSRGDEILDETAAPGSGFLADVCRDWEASSVSLEGLGVRRVVARTALVLARGAGALPRLALPFRFGVGGRLGSGRQWVSWIHVRDLVQALRFLIDDPGPGGVFNLAAPGALRQLELAERLGRQLRRSAWLPAPAPALRLLLGAMADELLLASQRVEPRRLLEQGFVFAQPGLDGALADIYPR